ncbi:unnamed protein product [Hanseniaspora opuntiae]
MNKFIAKFKKLIHTKRHSEQKENSDEHTKEQSLDNYSLFSEEQEEALPSSDEEENDEFSLFPKPIVVDNTLSVNSTVIPCSYNESSHAQATNNLLNSYTTQYNSFMNSDNTNNANGLLLSSIISPNTQNKYFNNGISFNNTSHLTSKSLFSPQSIRGSPHEENMATPQFSKTPQMMPPSVNSVRSNAQQTSPSISNEISPVSSSGNGTDVLPENFQLPEGVNYVCHYCDASFQVRGYLSRHIKKACHCQGYFKSDEEASAARKKFQSMKHVCHKHNGEFWRKDTLMIHLKKKHYSVDRNTLKLVLEQKKLEQGPHVKTKPKIDARKLPGTCTCCDEKFANADDFCNNHEKRGNNKCVLKLIKFSNNDARFIFTKSAVVEPEVFSNREVIDLIVDMAERKTPMSTNTPGENKLTAMSTNNSGNVLSPLSSNERMTPASQPLSMNKQTPMSATSGMTHQSPVDTPIVEKLHDNRIVIHPDQVVPIDANKKRRKRRSKKEMAEYREKLAREKMHKEQLKSTPQVDMGHLMHNQPTQLQLLMQIYQQQNMLIQQQQMQMASHGFQQKMEDDYQALDDDHYTAHVDYSPDSTKSGTTDASPNMAEQRSSDSSGSQRTYANKDLNTGYNMALQQKYGQVPLMGSKDADYGEEMAMDGGF